jgi:mannose-1-phosphate guanylyltransferase
MESGGPRAEARWGIILAGGEGTRLRALTRRISGDERPKQFCPLLEGETLIDQTRRRVALTVEPDRTLLVVTRHHELFYAPLLADVPSGRLVVQPRSRGTAPAILFGLLRVAEAGPLDAVALFPSDHYVSDDARFMAHVEAAFAAVHARPDLIILLGIEPDSPEVQYGWIEPGDPVFTRDGNAVYRVRRFWEKPPIAVAETLLARGCLWNSFVMVARVPALLGLFRHAAPDLYGAFMAARPRRSANGESDGMRSLYAALGPTDFSESVLGSRPANLAVVPVRGVSWSDWGEPDRVRLTLAQLHIHPEWAEPAAAVVA